MSGNAESLALAGQQFGVISRAEALHFLTLPQLAYRLRVGSWVQVFPRVYRVAGAPKTWRQTLEALSRWAGKGSALSHRTAAALHGLSRFEPGPLEVTMTRQRRVPQGVRVHPVGALPAKDIAEVDELRATSATRTLLDLSAATDLPTLRATLDEALRRKLTTLERLNAAVARSKNRPGMPDLRKLLHEFAGGDGPTQSELEALVFEVIDSCGLPKPKKQRAVRVGSKVRRVDFSFVKEGVIIEADGYAHHATLESFEDDRARNNSLTAKGFRVLHWTWQALRDRPEELVLELLATLNARR